MWLRVTEAVAPSIVTSLRNVRIWVGVEADWPCGAHHPSLDLYNGYPTHTVTQKLCGLLCGFSRK